MIYKIFFWWLGSGYTACSLLLGSYIVHYTGASSLDLAFLFMIHPATIFLRPLYCARADRLQKHRSMLCWCLAITSVAYTPFAIIPCLVQDPYYAHLLPNRTRFWIFLICHAIGSVSVCGIRALGDALAVNYAESVGQDFGSYRKYGSLSYGIFGYLIGQVNQNWYLPDFVPGQLINIGSVALVCLVMALSPKKYFIMQTKSAHNQLQESPRHLEAPSSQVATTNYQKNLTQGDLGQKQLESSNGVDKSMVESGGIQYLSIRQQTLIFWMLVKSDLRIPIYLLFIFYGGFVGYAPQNYVFTYINQYCNSREICDGAALSGTAMFVYCLVESTCYILIARLKKYVSYAALLSLTLFSLTLHYFFYGFVFEHVSPYFFLIESLHGLEYSISLVASVELGYMFANQVGDLLPELVRAGIVSEKDNHELVKVSLMATMSGLFTLMYEGIGTMFGAFTYGIIVDHYSFTTTWRVVGTLSALGLAAVATVWTGARCCNANSHKSRSVQSAA